MNKQHFACLVWLFSFTAFLTTYAQSEKAGKPNLKPYKEVLKQAKDGSSSAALVIAKVCKGHPLDDALVKDFKQAEKWYLKALANPQDSLAEAPKGLLEMYLTGGYGILKNIDLARKYHALYVQKAKYGTSLKIYMDKPNIDLKDFFVVYDSAQVGNKKAQFTLARMLWEFGLHPQAALATLQTVLDQPDALYLDEKWRLEADAYAKTGMTKLSDMMYYNLIEKHVLMGSNLARSEWAVLAVDAPQGSRFALKADEMQKMLATYTEPSPEMQFKMNIILQKYQQGVAHFATLRKIYGLSTQIDSVTLTLGQKEVDKYVNFDKSIPTLKSFVAFMGNNPATKLFDLDTLAYNNGFDGSIKPLLKLYKDLENPQVEILAGETHRLSYVKEINGQIRGIFDRIDKAKKLLEFKKAIENDMWLSYFKPEFDTLLQCRLQDFEINDSNIQAYSELLAMDEVKFRNITEGKNYLYALQNRVTDPLQRSRVASALKEKIIDDVYGEAPTKEKIDELQEVVNREFWLQPEGRERWFKYTLDSKNYFSGKVQRGNVYYAYTVTKVTGTDKYALVVKSVVNEKSNLAYQTNIKVVESNDNQIVLQLFYSKYIHYGWSISEKEYLRVTYKKDEPEVHAVATGAVSSHYNSNHKQARDIVWGKAAPKDFSEKTAIRTAVQHLIWEYDRLFSVK
jgi:hypothetical protein